MIKIGVPATSANIGSGFDALGLAIELYNYIYIELSDRIDISSLDGSRIPTDERNLVYSSAKYLFELSGKKLDGLKIYQENNIPITRGLGSSSACIVGGLLGANELLGNIYTQDDLVNIAANIEGHPDNTTPALLGGLVTSVMDNNMIYYVKIPMDSKLKFACFIPDFRVKTELARKLLPKKISHMDAVFNLSRTALMTASLFTNKFENLRVAVDDRLHQPYRKTLINGIDNIFEIGYACGAYAVYISGAGPTLIAIIDSNNNEFEPMADKMLKESCLSSWELKIFGLDNQGARIIPE